MDKNLSMKFYFQVYRWPNSNQKIRAGVLKNCFGYNLVISKIFWSAEISTDPRVFLKFLSCGIFFLKIWKLLKLTVAKAIHKFLIHLKIVFRKTCILISKKIWEQKFLQDPIFGPKKWRFFIKMHFVIYRQRCRNFCRKSEISVENQSSNTFANHIWNLGNYISYSKRTWTLGFEVKKTLFFLKSREM